MTEHPEVVLTSAVEGLLDEAVVGRLATELGVTVGPIHGNRQGIGYLLKQLGGYNAAANFSPWLVIADLDRAPCAPAFAQAKLPAPSEFMSFRIAVREVEAWLMGDAEHLASHLSVQPALVPGDPEGLADPKEAMVNLARRSRNRAIRAAMVPGPGVGHATGPAYTATLIDFVAKVTDGWRPILAAKRVDSLQRCLSAVADACDRYRSTRLRQ